MNGNQCRRPRIRPGVTMLELTVVILVLLALITILFIGARAWKRGSDRAANIMNLRNCQHAMRGHQNMNNLLVGDEFTRPMLEAYIQFPRQVNADLTYTAGEKITEVGALWLEVSDPGKPGSEYGPDVEEIQRW